MVTAIITTKLKEQEVWPPGSADTVCPRRPLMTLGQDGLDGSRNLATLTFDLGGHGSRGDAGHRPPCVHVYQV